MTFSLSLGPEDFALDDDELGEPIAEVLTVATRGLGSKQRAVRWLERLDDRTALAAAGSWDEPGCELALWRVSFAPADAMDADGAASAARSVSATPHEGGCVLGIEAAPRRLYTACGGGGVCCYAVEGVEEEAPSLRLAWRQAGTPSVATLGVGWDKGSGALCAVSEEGSLTQLDAASGMAVHAVATDELALYAVAWSRAAAGASAQAATVSSRLMLWDVRAAGKRPVLTLLPKPHSPEAVQLQCVSSDDARPHLLGAGSSEGSLYLWDARYPHAPAVAMEAHAADVWALQMCSCLYGDLLSCSTDGTVQARKWGSDSLATMEVGEGEPEVRTLVEQELPMNDLHFWPECGYLACASDAEVLTFIAVGESK
ncbi:hypothetical protein AB1Y20_013949 [Prymnesium parvum]|uniref:Peroxin-7 n=1 Tax=Prymnesium parvum TaxID=97485 RepID=A0AB34IGH0_PRYPA